MLVSEMMHKDFVAVLPSDSVQEVEKKMRDGNAGIALIMLNNDFEGLVTKREIAIATGNAADTRRTRSSDIINRKDSLMDEDRCCYFSDVAIELLLGK